MNNTENRLENQPVEKAISPEDTTELTETLPNEQLTEEIAEKDPPPPPPPPPVVEIKISSDYLMAYARVITFAPDQEINREMIDEALANKGITYGICNDEIDKFVAEKKYYTDLTVAKGLRPVNGVNGELEYHFKTDNDIAFMEREDGTVDYKELGLVQNVSEGQVLVSVIPPTPGKEGITIFGQPVGYREGIFPELPAGENTIVSPDKLLLKSAIDGCVEMVGKTVMVSDVYVVKGDVNLSVGNISCKGSVVVQGDVQEGFIIEAGKDITIKGMIEGATIICGGKVTISNGMNGMNHGTITAKGDVVSKYIENATVYSESTVYADVILNSHIKAKENVVLKGQKSSLIGGTCEAGKCIYAGYIGTHTNAKTNIIIESPALENLLLPTNDVSDKIDNVILEIERQKMSQDDLEDAIQQLTSNPPEGIDSKGTIKKLMLQKSSVAGKITELEQLLAELQKENSKVFEYKVVATKVCYTGTKINIAYMSLNIDDDYQNSKFYVDAHKITFGPVLPSDKM